MTVEKLIELLLQYPLDTPVALAEWLSNEADPAMVPLTKMSVMHGIGVQDMHHRYRTYETILIIGRMEDEDYYQS